MDALEKTDIYTSDEFLAMTDLKGRFELIGGEIYDMSPSPNIFHQRLSRELLVRINSYITDHHGKCEVIAAPSDVKLDDYNTVQPDIYVVCDPDKLDEQKCNGAPDWVIEIMSPSNGKRDAADKVFLYSKAGVREYWVIDPEEKKVMVHHFGKTNIVGLYTFDDTITAGIYKDAAEPLDICIEALLK